MTTSASKNVNKVFLREIGTSIFVFVVCAIFITLFIAERYTRTGEYVEYHHMLDIAKGWVFPFTVIILAWSFHGDYKRWKAKKAKK